MTITMPPSGIEARTYAYLYGMAEQLNLALSQMEAGQLETAAAISQTAGKSALRQQYATLKALVIKTADVVRAEMDTLAMSLKGEYVAQSDFGSYVQELSAYLEANPEAITQYYKFASDLEANVDAVDAAFQSYRLETGGYIRTGIVYYDGETPIYGVAVGQGLTTTEVDGETVVDQRQFRSTFTANRLSFWQDETEVAYVSDNQLYIGEVTVLRKLTLGNWVFSTDSGLAIKWGG